MNQYLKRFSKFYFETEKRMNNFLEKVVHKDLEKEKRSFYKKYKIDPIESEVKEFKKNILMKKTLLIFSVIVILIFLCMANL